MPERHVCHLTSITVDSSTFDSFTFDSSAPAYWPGRSCLLAGSVLLAVPIASNAPSLLTHPPSSAFQTSAPVFTAQRTSSTLLSNTPVQHAFLQFVLGCGSFEWLGQQTKKRPGYNAGDWFGTGQWVDNEDDSWRDYQTKELHVSELDNCEGFGERREPLVHADMFILALASFVHSVCNRCRAFACPERETRDACHRRDLHTRSALRQVRRRRVRPLHELRLVAQTKQ